MASLQVSAFQICGHLHSSSSCKALSGGLAALELRQNIQLSRHDLYLAVEFGALRIIVNRPNHFFSGIPIPSSTVRLLLSRFAICGS